MNVRPAILFSYFLRDDICIRVRTRYATRFHLFSLSTRHHAHIYINNNRLQATSTLFDDTFKGRFQRMQKKTIRDIKITIRGFFFKLALCHVSKQNHVFVVTNSCIEFFFMFSNVTVRGKHDEQTTIRDIFFKSALVQLKNMFVLV